MRALNVPSLLLFLLGAALMAQPCAATPGQWEFSGSLNLSTGYSASGMLTSGDIRIQ